MRYLKRTFYLFLIGLNFVLHTPSFALSLLSEKDSFPCALAVEDQIWISRLEGGYAVGPFMGFKKNYGEIGLFLTPPMWKNWQSITDFRSYWIDKYKWGGSFGQGFRFWNLKSARALGGIVYYDYRPGEHHSFQRMGVSLESLGTIWDFRLNGYLLINGSIKKGHLNVYRFPGGFIETCQIKEKALSSVDASIGCHVWQRKKMLLYSALGPYYLSGKHTHILGGFFSLQFDWAHHLTLEANVSYDNKFHTQFQGKVILSFALYGLLSEYLSDIGNRQILIQRVQRNPMIITQPRYKYTQNW